MTGTEIAKLMQDGDLKSRLAKHARRYSIRVEDQEEYIQDAWLRIAGHNSDMSNEYYAEQGRKAIKAAYYRERYVQKKKPKSMYGNSKKGDEKPRDAVDIGRGRFIDKNPETVIGWYYDREWEDWVSVPGYKEWAKRKDVEHHEVPKHHSVSKDAMKTRRVNRIAVTRLSQVKTEADWEEYEHRKSVESYEKLRHESGIGKGAYSLPDPSRQEGGDYMEKYNEGDPDE